MGSVTRPKVATVWLGGCSGCHMSLLDMDERLLDLSARMDLVFSPLMDVKTFPDGVDVTLVEGAVANENDARMIRTVRERTRVLVAFGDCAVTGNVTALRNPSGDPGRVLARSYPDSTSHIVADGLPRLLPRVQTIRDVVRVDYYLPGCPPSADLIFFVLNELLAGRTLDLRSRANQG